MPFRVCAGLGKWSHPSDYGKTALSERRARISISGQKEEIEGGRQERGNGGFRGEWTTLAKPFGDKSSG